MVTEVHSVDDFGLPPDETPVLALVGGKWRIAELRWDHPGYEDTYTSYRYWDDPEDEGQCWEWGDVTHWIELPGIPGAFQEKEHG